MKSNVTRPSVSDSSSVSNHPSVSGSSNLSNRPSSPRSSTARTLYIVQAGVIAALYVVLTMLAWGFDLASGAIQVRFSEMLCILPFFTPAAIPGVTIGCLLSNIIMGSALPDVIFGTFATFLGALGTYALRRNRWLCALPPILSNAVIVPLVLIYAYHLGDTFWFLFLTVGAGEVIAILIFGEVLLSALKPFAGRIFRRYGYEG